jgi:hypothetical protein
MATFTTSGTITAKILGYEFSGTGPHVCGDQHMAEIKAILEAGGETVSANKVTEQFYVLGQAAANIGQPLFVKPHAIVLTGAYITAAANIVGHADNYCTHSLVTFTTAGTVTPYGTPFSYTGGTAGTLVGGVKTSMGSLNTVTPLGTVPATYPLFYQKGTAGSGVTTSNILLTLEYTY